MKDIRRGMRYMSEDFDNYIVDKTKRENQGNLLTALVIGVGVVIIIVLANI